MNYKYNKYMNKKNLILGGILVALIVLAYLYQGPFKNWQVNKGKEKNFFKEIDFKSINKIEVVNAGKTTNLERFGDNWKVGGTKDFYVEKNLAKSMESSIEEAAKNNLEIVSASKDKKSEFKVDDNGVKVKFFKDNDLKLEFIVGKIGSDYKSTYISKDNSDKTYAVAANLFSIFNQQDWRDQIIFSSDESKISKIRFQLGKSEYSIEKSGDDWKALMPYNYKLNNEKVKKIISVMSNLTATEIPEQNFKGTGLDKNNLIIQATGEGVDNTLMIGEADKNGNFYAKKGDSDNIYLITKSQKDELNKKAQELR